MSILSRLFGSKPSADPAPEPGEEYKGFRITAAPMSESGGYRIAAKIEKTVDGEAKLHHLIRADTIAGHDEACAASLNKARQIIDEQGEALFR